MACMLLASIKEYFTGDVAAVGDCPEHRIKELHHGVVRAHEMLGAEIRPVRTVDTGNTPCLHSVPRLNPTMHSSFCYR